MEHDKVKKEIFRSDELDKIMRNHKNQPKEVAKFKEAMEIDKKDDNLDIDNKGSKTDDEASSENKSLKMNDEASTTENQAEKDIQNIN